MFGTSGPGHRGGVVITGCGCSPVGLLLSVVLSAALTLLANLGLRGRR